MSIEATQLGLGLGAIDATDKTGSLVDADQMGRDEFLTLLTAQIENQDPLNPQSNHEFVAQLATFSALEQQVQTNEKLENLHLNQKSMANGQLSSLIGKSIRSGGKALSIDGGTVPDIHIELAGAAEKVNITVLDEAGQAVAVVERDKFNKGSHAVKWEGIGADGTKLQDGKYSIQVSATDKSGNPVTATTQADGRVLGVTFEKGYPELILDVGRILPSEIISINEGENATPSTPTDDPSTDVPDTEANDGESDSTETSGQGSQSDSSDGGESTYGAAYSQLRRYTPPVIPYR